jgi:hypothetical protein
VDTDTAGNGQLSTVIAPALDGRVEPVPSRPGRATRRAVSPKIVGCNPPCAITITHEAASGKSPFGSGRIVSPDERQSRRSPPRFPFAAALICGFACLDGRERNWQAMTAKVINP